MPKGLIDCPCKCGLTLTQPFVFLLQSIEKEIGEDLIINSGARCETYNAKITKNKNSAHILGLAVDISTPDSQTRYKVLKCALSRGIKRMGWSAKDKFLHIDIATGNLLHPNDIREYPQMVAWDY